MKDGVIKSYELKMLQDKKYELKIKQSTFYKLVKPHLEEQRKRKEQERREKERKEQEKMKEHLHNKIVKLFCSYFYINSEDDCVLKMRS